MGKSRLEAFSDGVIAIAITIMVLELRVPVGDDLRALEPLLPVFLSYVLSFVYLGIYWNNHHHMLHTVQRVNGAILWANLALLFCLSLIPIATAWLGGNPQAIWPTAVYGGVLLATGFAYWTLQRAIIRSQGPDSLLRRAVGNDVKGWLSLIGYILSIVAAFIAPVISQVIFVAITILWLVPDPRIER
ncbi:MAG: TMEM175 family protein, partial [Thermoflexales bacterium]|nr:TMEM175 family protein [Thermoflexales bacterium]